MLISNFWLITSLFALSNAKAILNHEENWNSFACQIKPKIYEYYFFYAYKYYVDYSYIICIRWISLCISMEDVHYLFSSDLSQILTLLIFYFSFDLHSYENITKFASFRAIFLLNLQKTISKISSKHHTCIK